jgi:hypothetical protein
MLSSTELLENCIFLDLIRNSFISPSETRVELLCRKSRTVIYAYRMETIRKVYSLVSNIKLSRDETEHNILLSHVPEKGEQMVRYYAYYSKLSRGKLK